MNNKVTDFREMETHKKTILWILTSLKKIQPTQNTEYEQDKRYVTI